MSYCRVTHVLTTLHAQTRIGKKYPKLRNNVYISDKNVCEKRQKAQSLIFMKKKCLKSSIFYAARVDWTLKNTIKN